MKVSLDEFVPAQHTTLLQYWLARPHVSRWWLDPLSQLRICLDRAKPGSDHRVISVNGQPIGYIRWEPLRSNDLAAFVDIDIPDAAVDLDILIGDAAWIGRGVGPRALKLLNSLLLRETQMAFLMLSVSVENSSAINAYQKAGFYKVVEYDGGNYGRSQLMSRSIQ